MLDTRWIQVALDCREIRSLVYISVTAFWVKYHHVSLNINMLACIIPGAATYWPVQITGFKTIVIGGWIVRNVTINTKICIFLCWQQKFWCMKLTLKFSPDIFYGNCEFSQNWYDVHHQHSYIVMPLLGCDWKVSLIDQL